MDQIKIGRFIAENRRALSMTQVELAEKLGVSNKSVSKWERGVCLPDASLYFPLCEVLGVTISELFAGERLKPEAALKTAEKTIVAAAADSGRQEKRFNRLRVLFWAVLALVTLLLDLGLQNLGRMLSLLRAVHAALFLVLFFAACYYLIWLVFRRGKRGRVEDRAAGGFLDKMAFLKAGQNPNTPRFR